RTQRVDDAHIAFRHADATEGAAAFFKLRGPLEETLLVGIGEITALAGRQRPLLPRRQRAQRARREFRGLARAQQRGASVAALDHALPQQALLLGAQYP